MTFLILKTLFLLRDGIVWAKLISGHTELYMVMRKNTNGKTCEIRKNMCLNMVRKICAKVRKICEIGEMLSCVTTYILKQMEGWLHARR